MAIFKIVQDMAENIRFAFLYVLSVYSVYDVHCCNYISILVRIQYVPLLSVRLTSDGHVVYLSNLWHSHHLRRFSKHRWYTSLASHVMFSRG